MKSVVNSCCKHVFTKQTLEYLIFGNKKIAYHACFISDQKKQAAKKVRWQQCNHSGSGDEVFGLLMSRHTKPNLTTEFSDH